jgi:hypothetical protein
MYVKMMPRLEAQKALAAISTTAAGSGALKESDSRSYLGDLRRQASGTSTRVEKASYAQISQMGIKIKRVG